MINELINVRPLEISDLNELYQYKNDPSVRQSLGGFTSGYSRADLKDWIEYHRGRSDEVLYAIAEKDNGRCIGHIGLYRIDHRIRKAEFAILIGDPHWRGKGLGKGLSLEMLRYGFEELNLHKIELTVLEDNLPALRLYEAIGLQRDGVLRHEQFRSGKFRNLVMMSILEDEWRSKHAA